MITKLKLLTFINKNNLHKQIKVFNFVAQTKRKNIIKHKKFNKMEKIEIIKNINDCIDGLNGLISEVTISAKKVSKVCKLRRELTELKTEIEKKDEPRNN